MTEKNCQKQDLLTVHEVSKKSGVSIRTLHYYDEIGLLPAAATTEAGYRLYDEESLVQLQDILLFKELEFPLKDILKIMNRADFDRDKALEDQICLLELRAEHLEKLIRYAKSLQTKGEQKVSFKAFDKSKIEAYEKEAKEKWGDTAAYKEFEKKTAGMGVADKQAAGEQLMDLFREFGTLKDKDPACAEAQAQAKKVQDFITAHYYNCTKEIFAGLGQLYAAGGEMTDNIDAAGGKGCAEYASKAIAIFCCK